MILYLVSSLILATETTLKLLPNVPQTGRQVKEQRSKCTDTKSCLMVLRFFFSGSKVKKSITGWGLGDWAVILKGQILYFKNESIIC